MNRAFNVIKIILIAVSRNPERIVVTMYKNIDTILETDEDITSTKLQIRRF